MSPESPDYVMTYELFMSTIDGKNAKLGVMNQFGPPGKANKYAPIGLLNANMPYG